MNRGCARRSDSSERRRRWGEIIAVLVAGVSPCASAVDVETGLDDVRVVWDNTVKYNAAWRLKNASPALITGINQDDADRNFSRGLFSNRINLLSELDVTWRDLGARFSGAGWYDSIYNHSNDNNSPATANQFSVPYNQFTNATKELHGRRIELLDAFAFGRFNLGDGRVTLRAGRHSLLWGESLFFGANGIAGGQAPVDIQKAQSVPNTPFKELIRPVGQVSAQWQINSNVTLGAYYQYEWEPNRLAGVGSYFSTSDVVGPGGERLLAGPALVPGGLPAAFYRGTDINARDDGQGGAQVRFHLPDGETDFGLYAIRYHDKSPQLYLRPFAAPVLPIGELGIYSLVYAESVRAFGASFSRSIGDVNVAGEVSARRNTPLISSTQTVPPVPGARGDNNADARYAVGNSLHAQLSAIWTVAPTPLFREASFAGEVAWNRRTSITRNAAALDPNTTRDAWGFRFTFEPTYRQVFSGVDLGIPFGLGYNPRGRSSVVSVFNGNGVDKGGDVSIGLNAGYLDAWRMGLSYTHYFGAAGAFLDALSNKSFKQYFKDRDFVSFTVRRTF